MKKKSFLLLILIGITTLFSCSSDESDGNNSRQLKVEDIIGEWVYDHPEEGIWEKQSGRLFRRRLGTMVVLSLRPKE